MKLRFALTAIIVITLFVLLVAINVFWLPTIIILVLTAGRLISKMKRYRVIYYSFLVFYIFCNVIIWRIFIFETYHIPSDSMEGALYPGDQIFVNKFKYGPVLPYTPLQIPWLGALWYLYHPNSFRTGGKTWNYKRLQGFSTIDRCDIVVFTKGKNQEVIVKRCVGLPGDTIFVKNNRVIINTKLIRDPEFIKNNYNVWLNNESQFSVYADKAKIPYSIDYPSESSVVARVNLDKTLLFHLKDRHFLDSIKPVPYSAKSFPYSSEVSWTSDRFGPVRIPGHGLTINLTRRNCIIYYAAIKSEIPCELKDGKIYFRNTELKTYVFKYNYYFMLGDNRDNSNDSRFCGFISEKDIVGNVIPIFLPGSKRMSTLLSKHSLFKILSRS